MAAINKISTKTTTSTNNATKMMLYYTVIIACITSQFLSVNAIRCHQCNSHLEEECHSLTLNTPESGTDDQFLKECEKDHQAEAFCRKTILNIDVTGEERVVRGCGWIRDKAQNGGNTCFTADNEGYKQIICACNADGCNGSQMLSVSKWWVLGVTAVSVALATVFRGN